MKQTNFFSKKIAIITFLLLTVCCLFGFSPKYTNNNYDVIGNANFVTAPIGNLATFNPKAGWAIFEWKIWGYVGQAVNDIYDAVNNASEALILATIVVAGALTADSLVVVDTSIDKDIALYQQAMVIEEQTLLNSLDKSHTH